MNFQNIFGKAPSKPVLRLRGDTDEFDFSQTMLEQAITMEDTYFNIVREQMIATHLAMKEDSPEILQEGFKDFANSAVEFFKKLLAGFKEFMAKAFMYLQAYLGNFSKFIEKYKDQLSALDPNFSVDGYTYTFNSAIPNTEKLHNIITHYNNEISKVKTMTKSDVIKQREEYLSSETLDRTRAVAIGSGIPVTREEFLSSAKKAYRNGEDTPDKIIVNRSRLLQALDDYEGLKKIKKECEKDRNNVIRLIDDMKAFFQRSASVHYKDTTKVMQVQQVDIKDNSGLETRSKDLLDFNQNTLDVINVFFNFKFAESKEIGSIAITAVVEKIQALKEAIKMNEQIIRGSLSYTKKEDGDNA